MPLLVVLLPPLEPSASNFPLGFQMSMTDATKWLRPQHATNAPAPVMMKRAERAASKMDGVQRCTSFGYQLIVAVIGMVIGGGGGGKAGWLSTYFDDSEQLS